MSIPYSSAYAHEGCPYDSGLVPRLDVVRAIEAQSHRSQFGLPADSR